MLEGLLADLLDATTTAVDEAEDFELVLLELNSVAELKLELDSVSLDALRLLLAEVSTEEAEDEPTVGVSAFCVLGGIELMLELELAPSPSTPAAPPHAVKMSEKIMPKKVSLALFSAKESMFYTVRKFEFCN